MIRAQYIFFSLNFIDVYLSHSWRHRMSGFLMFDNAEWLLTASAFLPIVLVYIHDNRLENFFHCILQNDEFLILTFVMHLWAIIIRDRKICHSLARSKRVSDLSSTLFPKNSPSFSEGMGIRDCILGSRSAHCSWLAQLPATW